MIDSEKKDKIEFLVKRKYPSAGDVEKAFYRPKAPATIYGNYTRNNDQEDEVAAKYLEITKYRALLSALPEEEFNAQHTQELDRYNQENQQRLEEQEKRRVFNQPVANADFNHWSKAKYWTLLEAVALSFGKAPELANEATFSLEKGFSHFIVKFRKLHDLATRAKHGNDLSDPVLPGTFIAWARRMDIDFPEELEEKVIERGGYVADWKTRHDKLQKEHKELQDMVKLISEELTNKFQADSKSVVQIMNEVTKSLKLSGEAIAERDKELQLLEQERDELLEKVESLEGKLINEAKESLSTLERNTLLKLVLGMAMDGYGYNPKASRSSISREIEEHLQLKGISINEDTVRKYLNEAKEVVDYETEPVD